MELDLQSLFGLHVTWCAQLFSLAETLLPPSPPAFGLIKRGALLVSYDRRHLLVTPWIAPSYYESICGGRGGSCGVSCSQWVLLCTSVRWHGAQIYFWDLAPYLTYVASMSNSASIVQRRQASCWDCWPSDDDQLHVPTRSTCTSYTVKKVNISALWRDMALHTTDDFCCS